MAIAILSVVRSLFARAQGAGATHRSTHRPAHRFTQGQPIAVAGSHAVRRQRHETAKPLRIVHRGHGRMVISGRMADVCAELERLAALEATGSQALAPAR